MMEERLDLLWVAHVGVVNFLARSKPAFANHIQRWHSLRYFPDTTNVVEFPGARFEVPAGSYFCIPPNTPFKVLPASDQPPRYYDIKFLPSDPFLIEGLQKTPPPQKTDSSTKFMLDYIITHWHLQDPSVQGTCKDFLCALLRLLSTGEPEADAYDSQFILTDRYNKATLITLSYIEANYYIHFSISDVEKATGYSKGYLCTNFVNNTGLSITNYANFLRIRKAIGALLHLQPKITDISESLGFNNLNYFSRIFKSFVGIPPHDFLAVAKRTTAEERATICASEPLLNYQRCPLDDLLASMRHIGESFSARYQELGQ